MIMKLTVEQQQTLKSIARGRLCFNEPMREHTTIKIGGPADVWFEPLDKEDLLTVITWTNEREIPRTVFGNGSNILVRDGGIRGIVISTVKFNEIKMMDGQLEDPESVFVRAGSGALLSQLIGWSVEGGFSGFEYVAGIPGTVGGAVAMNAGTKEGSIGDVVHSLTLLGKEKTISIGKDRLDFQYRKLKLPKGSVIIDATFKLRPADKMEIEAKINKLRGHRKETQPLLWPSLGSVFKNPGNGPKAWRLIDDNRLRGVRIGGARVSNEHANWIINEGSATARDVEVLIKTIKERVKEESGILLEPEIIIVGE